jgi:agmatine deiminase
MNIRLPAEWEKQDGVLIAWPHPATDWNEQLNEVLDVYTELIRAIICFEKVLLVTPEPETVTSHLLSKGIPLSDIIICPTLTNDTWTRDFGPITVLENNKPVLLDFAFNGWGLKFASDLDNQVTRKLKQNGFLNPEVKTISLILEGGSIESDGCGTLLTTSQCLLSPNRNPHLNREQLTGILTELFGLQP